VSAVGGDPPPFDVCGPLPTGVTLLEASAGTGKTFTIAALAARYVAEGTPLDRLLVVSFTRNATFELRARVRDRFVDTAKALSLAVEAPTPALTDPVAALLASGGRELTEVRLARLAAAIANFDAATIETTDGFCRLVLSGLGTAGEVEPAVSFVPDVRDLLAEVVDDLYVRRFWQGDDAPPFSRREALRIGEAVLNNPSARILPPLSDERSASAMRRRLAGRIRDEIDHRKRVRQLLTYDDVLTRLDRTLAVDNQGDIACEKLRDRCDVVLVDEFQDTDPIQWDILRRAFGSGATTLVLIGDPKQAIYGFRGADVYAYLEAADLAATKATLDVNWRSDQGLIDAYDGLFGVSQLGHPGIAYRKVRAAPAHMRARLVGAPINPALRVRVVERDQVERTYNGYANVGSSRALIAADLAADLVALLSSGAELEHRGPDGGQLGRERVRPAHVAVLLRSNRDAAVVRDALHAAGLPAVISGAGSVFATAPATEWLRLLEALERPTARDRATVVALSSFIGWTAGQAAMASDEEWEDLHWRLHRWAALLRDRGVAPLLENIAVSQLLPSRILSRVSGERFLTDLRHVGQLLHSAEVGEDLGPTALTAWLRRRIAEAARDSRDTTDEDRSRRLDSDAEAVSVLTIHRSKGLEFPIVYCPSLWDGWSPDPDIPVFHDPDADDARSIDVGGDGSDYGAHCRLEAVEQRGEDLRLLYVALTRAKHQAVLWWAGAWNSGRSPLGRLLLCTDEAGLVGPGVKEPPSEAAVRARVSEIPGVSVEGVVVDEVASWAGDQAPTAQLEAGIFTRQIDRQWRRTSYSGITSAAHEPRVGSEAEGRVVTDEEAGAFVGGAPDDVDPALRHAPLWLAGMPGGATVGTIIHSVLEGTDFTAVDLPDRLRAGIEAELARRPVDLGDLDAVIAGLVAMISSPLGQAVGDVRLRDVGPSDRLDELDFELPLVGGDIPSAELSLADVADLLRRHVDPDDPLAGYADRLADPALEPTLRGYLSGSLDLVLRLPGPRFAVVDYKTNWLGDESLTAWHYRPSALATEMRRAHYELQALLYTVALHRYLRWRLPGYSAARNLAGALYLFVRGMSSPEPVVVGGQPCGVWSWQPPASLIEALSDLLDRGAT